MNLSLSTINYSSGAVSLTFTNPVGSGRAITINYQTNGWGSGHGLLDEDGTCPAKGYRNCWLPTNAYNDSGPNVTPALHNDMNNFLYHHAKQYFGVIRSKINADRPGFLYFGPTGMGSFCAPPRVPVLRAANSQLDVLTLNLMPCGVSDDQARYDFLADNGGDKPWIEWEGWTANPDSYFSPYRNPGGVVPAPQTTQARKDPLYYTRPLSANS
jgi:hypothetical protein